MELGLKGKKALVLGSSSGIGYSIARELVREGARVAISARTPERLEAAARELGAAAALSVDLIVPGAARGLVERASDALGGLDILVTNAGGPPAGRFGEITDEQWLLGYRGLFASAQEAISAALPGMRRARFGRILLVTSMVAREPSPTITVSSSLRPALHGLAKSLSREVAADGITINCVLPGYTRTERLQELGIPEEQIRAQVPAGRIGEPEELAALVAFLASERASYVTGEAIACDGGFLRSM